MSYFSPLQPPGGNEHTMLVIDQHRREVCRIATIEIIVAVIVFSYYFTVSLFSVLTYPRQTDFLQQHFFITKTSNMKKIFFCLFILPVVFTACTGKTEATTASSSIKLPYEVVYTTDFNDNISDSDLLLVLNSYKAWEGNDMNALRATMGDSMRVDESDGFTFNGLSDSLMNRWTPARDSLSSVSITMDVWRKNHSVKDSADYITVWYKEIDTHKSGVIDSANYADVNQVKNGKIVWYSQFKQKMK